MKIYVGEVIKEAVDNPNQPIPKTKIAGMLKITRQQLYNLINNPEIEIDYLLKIGRAIGRDFSIDFPEMKSYNGITVVSEPDGAYNLRSSENMEQQLLDLQGKYIRVLEDNADLRKRVSELEKGKK